MFAHNCIMVFFGSDDGYFTCMSWMHVLRHGLNYFWGFVVRQMHYTLQTYSLLL